ncbi:MAG: hypothetical protein Q8P34_09565 [Bacteroidota bacterium]|nr:hypothetical protein [Bacteroidota bacterium]
MTTIVINDRTTGAKKMIEFLKTQSYVTIIEEKTPSASLAKSINEAKAGKMTRTKNASDLLENLNRN